ncbi:DrmE family protein [Paenibacillus sp. UNC451MF]|uniref:DrmE family protein n=1 Tax=Paenibacillus sp. UNC451MF TaxID=1449063 RepID=UPI00048CE640|nr:DrmE family protein [Paenibacillus sp. UNC451MF]
MCLSICDSLSNAYTKSSFYISGKSVGKFDLLNENSRIFIDLLAGSGKRRGVVLHPGTNSLLYIAIAMAAYNVFLLEESDNTAFLQEIKDGDLVVYGDKRGKYRGVDGEGKIIIESAGKGSPLTTYVPTALAYKLRPYYGSATTLDGRGIRRNSTARLKFMANLFSIELNQMKNSFSTSVVIVCDKQDADEFMATFRISVDNRKSFSFGELFPSAYYTSSGEEINYPGNSARLQSIVKFAGKLSVARELILEDKNIGTLIINGSHFFNDSTELASLYKRNSLKSIVMLAELSKYINSFKYDDFENVELYAWTRNALLGKIGDLSDYLNDSSDMSKLLYEMANSYINKEIHLSQINDPLGRTNFFECRKLLYQIARSSVNEDTEQFVIKGFSLFNHFQRSIFPIVVMDNIVMSGRVNFSLPSVVLSEMEDILNRNIETAMADDMLSVIMILAELKTAFYENNPKFEILKEIVKSHQYGKKRLAVIIAKNYYIHIFKQALPASLTSIADKIDFFTPNRFNTKKKYDEVIFTGVFDWKTLDPSSLCNTRNVRVILYENEQKLYSQAKTHSENCINHIENLSKLTQNDTQQELLANEKNDSNEYEEIFIEETLEGLMGKSLKDSIYIQSIDSNIKQEADIVKIAIIETGEYVYFTRHYTAYVFDVERQSVVETGVTELNAGDMIILTNYDSGTRDIVERIMHRMVSENKCDEMFKEYYRRSTHWKNILKEYIYQHGLSYKNLSDKLYEIGKGKHETTLRSWLDEDSHIVGPRDSESYYAIAILTDDPEMLTDPDSFREASKQVRSMRVRILRFIASEIIKKYGRTDNSSGELFTDLWDDIAKMSMLLQIESIVEVENISIPAHLANRPILN